MTPSWRLMLLTLAFVVFLVAAYLSSDLATRLTRAAFAIATLAFLL